MTCSAQQMWGIAEIWDMILRHRTAFDNAGELIQKRRQQALDWMTALIQEGLDTWFYQSANVKKRLPEITHEVLRGRLTPTAGALELLEFLDKGRNASDSDVKIA